MPERLEALRQILVQLHEQLETGESLRPESRVLLEEAIQEIQSSLDEAQAGKPPTREEHPTLLDRVAALAEEFEESHPGLSAVLGRITNALSNLGI